MTALWTSVEAEGATLGHASAPFAASGISIDTRTLRPGDLFVALKGDTRDGHDFVRAAFDARASAALVSRQCKEVSGPELGVANSLRGLEDLARAARVRCHAKIVAVTGRSEEHTSELQSHSFISY